MEFTGYLKLLNYNFTCPYPYESEWSSGYPCVYVIVYNSSPIYVGETGDIRQRFSNHHKKDCWEKFAPGQYSVYVLHETREQRRLEIEKEIKDYFSPVCND